MTYLYPPDDKRDMNITNDELNHSRRSALFLREELIGMEKVPIELLRKFQRNYLRMLPIPSSILLYHQLTKESEYPAFQPLLGLKVDVKCFEEQMAYVSRKYQCLELSKMVAAIRAGKLQRRSLTVTFDDGYYDTLALALPILERYRVPATIYITTGLADGTSSDWWEELQGFIETCKKVDCLWQGEHLSFITETLEEKNEAFKVIFNLMQGLNELEQRELMDRMAVGTRAKEKEPSRFLDWHDIKLLDRHPLITIGAHTLTHAALSRCSAERSSVEIKLSKVILEAKLNHVIEHFAYPFGGMAQVAPRDIHSAAFAGYSSACVTYFDHVSVRRYKNACHALPRISIDYFDTYAKFCRKLHGFDAFVYRYVKRNAGPTGLLKRIRQNADSIGHDPLESNT